MPIIVSNTGRINVNTTSQVGKVNVNVNQVAHAQTRTRSVSNIPVGLYFSYEDSKLHIEKGFVTVNDTKYILTTNWVKLPIAWSAGTGGGLFLSNIPNNYTGDAYIYAIGDGTKTDIGASLLENPILPTGYTKYTELGYISFENGAIVSVYPTKDLAATFIDGDYAKEIAGLTSSVITLQIDVADLKTKQNYVHEQGVSSDLWTIQHNLNKKPSVTVVDSGDTIVTGLVTYIDDNNIQIRFNSAFKGTAYLN